MKRNDEKIKNFQSYMKRKGIDACAVTDLDGVNFFADFSSYSFCFSYYFVF